MNGYLCKNSGILAKTFEDWSTSAPRKGLATQITGAIASPWMFETAVKKCDMSLWPRSKRSLEELSKMWVRSLAHFATRRACHLLAERLKARDCL